MLTVTIKPTMQSDVVVSAFILSIVMMNAVMPSVVMLNVVCRYAECRMLQVVMRSVVMLIFVMLNVVMLSVVSGNTKGGSITVLLTSCLTGLESAVRQLTIFVFYLQNRQIQTGQTGGQLYSDTYPFSPWSHAVCRYTECRYAECRYAECRCAECRGAVDVTATKTKERKNLNHKIFD